MATIRDQLAWEERMIAHGVSRYRAQQDKAVEGGRAHETSAGSSLLRAYVVQISDHVRLYLDGKHPAGRRRNKYAKLLATIDTDKAAMMALKAIISTLYNPASTQTTLINVARTIEDELRFSKFEEEHKEYYDEVVRSWEAKRTSNYRHKRNTLSVKSRDLGVEWEVWSKDTLLGVGGLIVSLLMEVCDLIELRHITNNRGHKDTVLAPTPECIEWVLQHNQNAEIGNPDRMPCLIPPDDWVSPTDGGYYSPRVRKRSPLVKTRGKTRDALTAEMPEVLSAVNAMQRTAWTVNTRVLDVMREVWHRNLQIGMPRTAPYEIPNSPLPGDLKIADLNDNDPRIEAFEEWKAAARALHTMEKERVSQNLAVSRTIRIATEMQKHEEFYYVYQCDFRGRVYSTTSGLSPQGTDHSKSLIKFAVGKPLGERGLYWLKVHGANKYGFDKEDYDARVAWIDARDADLRRVADDPIAARDVWKDADKPYQFLAFCFEYAEARRVGPSYVSHLPVALDGSCNGIQHFSAMLRDPVGAAAVNLQPGPKPADIYQQVADVCTAKLKKIRANPGSGDAGASNWLWALRESTGAERIPRALSKKPVMTLPYGSTQQTCTSSVFQWSQDNMPGLFEENTEFRHAIYISPKLWASISEVVVAARQAMDWLQNCASLLAKMGHPIRYTSPLGFTMVQSSWKYTTRRINTQINGRLYLHMAVDTDQLDSRKQRQGASPNFVHCIDAAHLMMTVNASVARGIENFAMIHDDFGTHACDVDTFHEVIREEFVRLHTESVLEDFKSQHEELYGIELPPLPEYGDFDISKVLKSHFFFG